MPADLLIGSVALGILLLPGWLAARAARIPSPVIGGFIASVVMLVALVLFLDAVGARLTLRSFAAGWMAITVGMAALDRARNRDSPTLPAYSPFDWRAHGLLMAGLLPVIAVLIYRATTQPLFGADTVFRWDHLARQMIAQESIGFYPPVSAHDFELYAWCDGIPPAISSLYFVGYALGRATHAALTAPVVLFQGFLVGLVTFALARRTFSDRAAAFACGLLAATPAVGWATIMGQETGLTAVAAAALLLYLPRDSAEETRSAVIFAALAASAGALSREYGLVLIPLGLLLCVARKLSRPGVLLFLLVAATAAAPWYVRNWIRTGNPLFNNSLGSLFPVNNVHASLMAGYGDEFGLRHLPASALRLTLTNCGAALLLGAIGMILYYRSARALILVVLVFIALWAASLAYTAAGFIIGLRVLNPALVLGAVLGGAALERAWPSRRYLAGASVALLLLALDASARTLVLPANCYRLPLRQWPTAGDAVRQFNELPSFAHIAKLVGPTRLLVLGPNAQLSAQGARALPLWSPEVDFLFDDRISAPAAAARLRGLNIGYMLLNQGPANARFLNGSRFFREAGPALSLAWQGDAMVLLKVNPAPAREQTP